MSRRKYASRSRSNDFLPDKNRHKSSGRCNDKTTCDNNEISSDLKVKNNIKQILYCPRNDEIIRVKKELEEAHRHDLTVLVAGLSLRAEEFDVYDHFTKNAGKVRDIRIIRDQRSGKSKGICYIEFYSPDAVLKALTLSGQLILGQPIKIQASQAEKNRAAKLAKLQELEATETPLKLFVGGLVNALAEIYENDIKDLFEPFGNIIKIELPRDPYTKRSRGYSYVTFLRSSDAKEAMSAMNGFKIAGEILSVGIFKDSISHVTINSNSITAVPSKAIVSSLGAQKINENVLDESDGGLLSGVASRNLLMQKLQEKETTRVLPNSLLESPANIDIDVQQTSSLGARNIILSNMFTAEEVDLAKEPEFFKDILEDIASECEKYGTVEKIWTNQKKIDGKVWVRFSSTTASQSTANAMSGRYFGGKPVTVTYATDAMFNTVSE